MNKLNSIFAFIVLSAVAFSCYRNKEEEVYPTVKSGCDTLSVTYSQTIAPLMKSQCTSCHGGSSPSAGIGLDSYEKVKKVADNGKLYGSINHSPSYSPMPKGKDKLPECQIILLKKWVDNGAQNN
jgi:hypothetical protein